MSDRIIEGRPKLPPAEERLALPPPEAREDDAPSPTPWHRRWAFWVPVAGLAALLAAVLFMGGGGQSQGEGGEQPPATVSVARVRQAEWAEQLTAVGTVRAIQGVNVTTEIEGTVQAIRFTNGERARRGETLVQLDTTTERAQLRALLAQANQARLALARAERLSVRGAIAQAEVEVARANYDNLTAQAEQVRTVIEKKRIDAPFGGDLGIRQVNLGQYVGPGTAIVSLQQLAPIYVNFELPEGALAQVREGQRVRLAVSAFGGRTFEGRINAINPEVAQATRNFTVQAVVPNGDRALRPGMFADVTVLLPGVRRVLVVPAAAVTTNAYGEAVYLVARPDPRQQAQEQQRREQAEKEEGGFLARLFGGSSGGAGKSGGSGKSGGGGSGAEKGGEKAGGQQPAQPQLVAKTVFVRAGERRGNDIEITRGLRPGQPVVTAGQLKLDDNAPVVVARPQRGQAAPAQPRQP